MATTLPEQQSRWEGRLTRDFTITESTNFYFRSNESLGVTGTVYFVIDPDNSKAEIVKATFTGTSAEYTATITTRGLRKYGSDTNVSNNQFGHSASAKIIISDNHNWIKRVIDAFNTHEDLASSFHGFAGIGVIANIPSAASNSGKLYYATDELVLYYSNGTDWDAQSAGTIPDASTTVKGSTKMSVAPASATSPIAVGDNDPRLTSSANMTDLTDGLDTTLHYHASDRSRANHTGTQDMSTLINTGTAGETLNATELVALSTDNKLYKATNTSATLSRVVGIITVGGAANATVSYAPTTIGKTYTTTGLTAGTTYYLSTAGGVTATPPVLNSSSVYPVIVGYAASTTVLVWGVRRLQRRTMGIGNIVAGTTTTSTLTVGYPIERVMVNFSMKGGADFTSGDGHYDVLAGTQEQQGPQGSSSHFIYVLDMADGTGTKTGTASVNGSNNIEIAWVESSFSAGNNALFYRWTAFERL